MLAHACANVKSVEGKKIAENHFTAMNNREEFSDWFRPMLAKFATVIVGSTRITQWGCVCVSFENESGRRRKKHRQQ